MVYVWLRFGKPDPGMMVNGMLAGLVAITAPCAFVTSVVGRPHRRRRRRARRRGGALRREERSSSTTRSAPSRCTASTALWGVLALGLFADGTYGDGWNGVPGTVKGLFYGDPRQFVAAGASAPSRASSGSSIMFYIFFKVCDAILGNRVSAETELAGLDIPEMGVLGYPDFVAQTRMR